jgi:hypothetical protein
MTSSAPPPEAETETGPDEGPSPAMRTLGIVMIVIPVLGLAAHVVMYLVAMDQGGRPPWMVEYMHGPVMKIVGFLAFLNLVGNWLHYRHTRMRLDIAGRILTYFWIISLVLLIKAAMSGQANS